MAWFGGRVQRTSEKAAVVCGVLAVVGLAAQAVGPYLDGMLAREAILNGTMATAVGLVGLVVSLIVRVARTSSTTRSQPGGPSAPAGAGGPVAPGWYPDHEDPHLWRYHDGWAWTSQTAPRG